ncbi:isoprenylcysteine carboxylmethyltransferase family protein [Pseudohalioglobus sediminis]|uniref:Isoprenylcysteine carboxylmethyltransferase family protein n=1 Tax=Pseudohalioglobus sediminis TaxID=2606449 RepID=A0A5B0X6Y1_9GAMM|nr:isoprenylcysteine carboxylmethyltransferase family protein [Pseudohalioglobus sediminis]KAA1194348.1 isoprenylcysteine carboxylmethyltransferase family protein [Pseudohalioglobus sediminis]
MKYVKFGYSLGVYSAFLGIFTYLVLFIGAGPLAEFLPALAALKSVDSGPAILSLPLVPAVVNNIVLLLAFAIQHSVMARKEFKALIAGLVPDDMERSTYVLMTCLVLLWIYLAWMPMPTLVWEAYGTISHVLLVVFLAGAGLVLWSTFMISHWQLFGLSQAWHSLMGTQPPQEEFTEPALYKYSRHPMYLGVLMVLWATPVMSVGHLLMAAIWSVYVFVGIGYEERDLLERFGDRYSDYMARVPQLLPLGRRQRD